MLIQRLRSLLRRRDAERDLDEELQYHVQCQIKEFTAAGMTVEEARRAALLSFGGVEQWKEECRDKRGLTFLESILADMLYALRSMRRNPGFTTAAVLCLALGIGANTAMFTAINSVLLRPLPYADSERLVTVFESSKRFQARTQATWLMYCALRDRSRTLDGIASYVRTGLTLTGSDAPVDLDGVAVSASFFPLLGVRPEVGRLFQEGEDRQGHNVVVLSHGAWQRYFGGDSAAVGRTVKFSNYPSFTVVGILPRDFRFESAGDAEVWLPGWVEESGPGAGDNRWYLNTIARLKSGVSVAEAQADLDSVARSATGGNSSVEVVSVRGEMVKQSRRSLLLLFAAVTLVLLIAIGNAANLQIAHAASRTREVAVRAAIGASRRRLVRQLLVESMTLAAAGGATGLLVAYAGVRLLRQIGATQWPRMHEIAIDGRVLFFTAAMSLLTGIVFGLVPAISVSRVDLRSALSESARTGTKPRRLGAGMIVAGELALALVLVSGAGLLLHSLWRLVHTNPGFQAHQVFTMRVKLPYPAYRGARAGDFARMMLDRLAAMPGVEGVAVTTQLPMGGSNEFQGFEIVGGPAIPKPERQSLQIRAVSPDYFRAMRIPLLKGRWFTNADAEGAAPVAIVNELMERRFFGGNALGRRVLADDVRPMEIVGVVGNVRHQKLSSEPLPERYVPFAQARRARMHLVVRTSNKPAVLAPAIRAELRQLDRDVLGLDAMMMEDRRNDALGFPDLLMMFLGVFAGIAMVLACAGVYGVVSYSVTQRTHEIGVRMALGASRIEIIRFLLKNLALLTTLGLVVGVVAALAGARLLERFLFEVQPGDPVALGAAAAILALAALLAAFIPAVRATRMTPLAALRME